MAAGIAITCGPVQAQPAFDVAVVKQWHPPAGDSFNITLGAPQNGKVTFANATFSDCLKFAYNLVSDEQIAGPDWIKSRAVRFDIVGQAPAETPREQLQVMVQTLLAERMKLKVHYEQKTLSHLALVVGKNGPKLLPPNMSGDNSIGGGRINGNHMSMQLLASMLSRLERQIVVDRTELKGLFEVHLKWTPDNNSPNAPNSETVPEAGLSLFKAIQEQLGLKLESRKSPLDILVIDQAEKVPTEN